MLFVTSVQCVRRLLALPCIVLVSKTASYAGYGNEIVENCPLYEQNNNLARASPVLEKMTTLHVHHTLLVHFFAVTTAQLGREVC